MWWLIAKRTFSPDSKVDLAVHNARASTIVLRFSLRATSYEKQHLQIYQVLSHQTNWEWRCQRCLFETSDSDFRSNLKRQRTLISVLYRLICGRHGWRAAPGAHFFMLTISSGPSSIFTQRLRTEAIYLFRPYSGGLSVGKQAREDEMAGGR
jgi:hypothetical protein